jgi:hypothetical protein
VYSGIASITNSGIAENNKSNNVAPITTVKPITPSLSIELPVLGNLACSKPRVMIDGSCAQHAESSHRQPRQFS